MATTTTDLTRHYPASMAYIDTRYVVVCHCGWKAEMPARLVHSSTHYTQRLQRIGYEQHETIMRQVL